MDCYFRQYWRDTRLSFKGLKMTSNHIDINQLSLNVKMLEKIWKPDTFFHNGLDSYLHTITRPNKLFRISENGDITYSMRSDILMRFSLGCIAAFWRVDISFCLCFGKFYFDQNFVLMFPEAFKLPTQIMVSSFYPRDTTTNYPISYCLIQG